MTEQCIPIPERIKMLQNIPVFSGLNPNALSEIAGLLNEVRTRAQEPLFRKGDTGEQMYILVEGEVRVHDGNHVIARLLQGDVFGEFALLDDEKRSASVTTEKPCVLLTLGRSTLLPFMTRNPEILLGMLHTQIKRMREMNELREKLAKSYLKIRKQNEEIEGQNAAIIEQKQLLEEQNEELRALNEQKRQLMSVLIHGLKNPLTSAMMMADMLESGVKGQEEEEEYLSILKQSLQRMDLVFNDIIRDNKRE